MGEGVISPGSPATAVQVFGFIGRDVNQANAESRREWERRVNEFTWQIASPNKHNCSGALLATLTILEDF